MDSNRLGDDRLIRAIQTGKPVPGTPEQAAELAGTRRANIVKCAECGEVGDRGYFGKNTANPIPLPICAKCKAEADAVEEGKIGVLRQALDAAFAPIVALAQKPARAKPMTAREIVADELTHLAMGYHEDHERTLAFVNRMLRHYANETYPEYIDDGDHRCENCNCLTRADTREEGSVYDDRTEVIDTWVCPCCDMEVDQ